MASNNYIFKMSNAGGMATVTRYTDMLAGNITWNPWEPTGAYDALATVTVPSGGAASIEFAGIPTGYKHLQIRGITRATSSAGGSTVEYGASAQITFNGDTGANYAIHYIQGNGSAASANNIPNYNYILLSDAGGPWATSTAGTFSGVIIDILDYSSTTKNKTIRALTGQDRNGYGRSMFQSGLWYKTPEPITSIKFGTDGTSYAEFSQFALYGVK